MDIIAFIILEETLDKLPAWQIAPDRRSRLEQCVTVIRACMDLIALNPANRAYIDKMQQAITELAKIARESGDLVVAGRLKMIAYQLSGGAERRFVKTA
jgi:hypothetical protein